MGDKLGTGKHFPQEPSSSQGWLIMILVTFEHCTLYNDDTVDQDTWDRAYVTIASCKQPTVDPPVSELQD